MYRKENSFFNSVRIESLIKFKLTLQNIHFFIMIIKI